MCGRYAMRLAPEELKHAIEDAGLPVDEVKGLEKVHPSLNVAPRSYSMVYCSPAEGQFNLEAMQWTLQPSYAKEPVKYPSFNTRVESLSPLKPAWRSAKSRRGIVFMSGYYEWQRQDKQKLPFYMHDSSDELLAVLAVWDTNPTLGETPTYSIVTTTAASDLEYIHPRMPVVTTYERAIRWIEGKWPDVLDVAHPMPGLDSYRVASDVNKVGVDRPGLSDRLADKQQANLPKKSRPVTDWFAPAKPTKRGTSAEPDAKKQRTGSNA